MSPKYGKKDMLGLAKEPFTWKRRIDMGTPLRRIWPRVGPWARLEITSSRARLPEPPQSKILKH